MAQPFVISMRIDGDSKSAVAATTAQRQAVDSLAAATDAARTRVDALNAATQSRQAAKVDVANYEGTLAGIRAEQQLEAARLSAQITETGRAQSLQRAAELARDAGNASQALAKAERELSLSELEVSRSTDLASSSRERVAQTLDDLRAKYSPLYAAGRQYQATVTEIEQAHKVGALSAKEMTAALERERVAYERLTATAAAANNNQVLPGSGKGAQSFNTANVAAQFQDIAVTSAMGMSPLQIALQQGTQLSAILGTQGAAGAAKTLGAALVSVISPVSLLTIATVALGAAGIQAFFGMLNSANDATKSLEDHKKWLDQILVGYDEAKVAAGKAADEALRLPREAVASNLGATYVTAQAAFVEKLRETEAAQARVNAQVKELQFFQQSLTAGDELYGPVVKATEEINRFALSAGSTSGEIAKFITNVTQLNNATRDEGIKTKTAELVALGTEILDRKAQVDSLSAALANLANSAPINIKINVQTDAAFDAIRQLEDQAPDLRSSREKARDTYNTAIGAAPDGIIRQAAEVQYRKTLDALDAQDDQKAAEKAARSSARSAKEVSQYDQAIAQIRERTKAQELETNVISLSAFASEKARQQFELENAARKDGVGLTAQRVAEIDREASAYAAVTAALDRQKSAYDEVTKVAENTIDTIVGGFLDGESSILDVIGNIGKEWAAMLLQMAVSNPIKNALLGQNNPTLSDAGGWIGSIFSTLFGGSGGSGLGKGLTGAAVYGGTNGVYGVPGFATGTNSAPGGLARIHEEGGEIVDLPNGARVYPADLSRMMASTGSGSAGAAEKPGLTVFNMASNTTIREGQESDRQGGRKPDWVVEEAVASSLARPRGPAQQALGAAGRVTRR